MTDENVQVGDVQLGEHMQNTGPSGAIPVPCDRTLQVTRSSLWAAYGDALGWISELTDKPGLDRRTKGVPLQRPVKWRRFIGGRRYGITIDLPRGCYSDDTQLRLATSRAISRGWFDVDSFAKIELPVWLSYKFGAGRASTAASRNLAKRGVTWHLNQFKGWENSGGNGAAMRVQPHIWATRDLNNPNSFLPDVIHNTVCTHSHPVGILGALLHALTLAETLDSQSIPGPDRLLNLLDSADAATELVKNDDKLKLTWWPTRESVAGSFQSEWEHTVVQCRAAIRVAAECTESKSGEAGYSEIIDKLDLKNPQTRGSATLCAIAAVALSWCEPNIESALTVAANALGTDTDTIATMSGAIMGVIAKEDPPVDVLDEELIRSEAQRLAAMASGSATAGHKYPEIHLWQAPRTLGDAIYSTADGSYWMSGLGPAVQLEDPVPSRDSKFQWQWLRLSFGQTIFIRRRTKLPEVPNNEVQTSSSDLFSISESSSMSTQRKIDSTVSTETTQPIGNGDYSGDSEPPRLTDKELDIDTAIEFVRTNIEDHQAIGKAVRKVFEKGSSAAKFKFVSGLCEIFQPAHNPEVPARQSSNEESAKSAER